MSRSYERSAVAEDHPFQAGRRKHQRETLAAAPRATFVRLAMASAKLDSLVVRSLGQD